MRIRHIKGVEELIKAEELVISKPENHRGKWRSEVFGNDAPLCLEIGMGMGRFIRTHSFMHPEINYIGLELNTTVLYKALSRYKAERDELLRQGADCATQDGAKTAPSAGAEAGVRDDVAVSGTIASSVVDGASIAGTKGTHMSTYDNLRFIQSNARFIDEYFDAGEIDKIYLNFSDPWPKERSAGRRLTSPQFLSLYDKVLKPDGSIEFKTDNKGLFDYSLETLPSCGWELSVVSYDLHHDTSLNAGNIMTEYEEKFAGKGNPIYKLIAIRQV